MAAAKKVVLVILAFLTCFSVLAIQTFHVEETNLVKVQVEATDLDEDEIIYLYPSPLDERGQWQTGYGDAGEYELEINATDGKNQTSKKILLVVANKNRAPLLSEKKIVVKETQKVDLKTLVSDPDGDLLAYVFSPPFNNQGAWETSYADEGTHAAVFQVSDGELDQEFRVEVQVLQTNQPPNLARRFSETSSLDAEENETIKFWVEAEDQDNDPLTYAWSLDGTAISSGPSGSYRLGFDSAGSRQLSLTITDGENSLTEKWNLEVSNTNRAPALNLLPITIREGEKVVLSLPQKDEDGDAVTYAYEPPLKEGEWQTGLDDAGEYSLKIEASDDRLASEGRIRINVLDVDRAPFLQAPEVFKFREGAPASFALGISDPDEDETEISFESLPPGAIFNKKNGTLSWTPPFDTVTRPGGFFSSLLNELRLEKFLLSVKTLPVVIKGCGKELCTSQTVLFKVSNVNHAPEFTVLPEFTLKETESIQLSAEAIDPDGDRIHYYFSSPAGKRKGKWKTGYEDAGTYWIDVTATDGEAETIKPVKVTVLEKNREPQLKVAQDDLTVNEGQKFSLEVAATDPDEQKKSAEEVAEDVEEESNATFIQAASDELTASGELTLSLANLPPGASFSDGIFTWQPGYETVLEKNSSFWNDLASSFSYLNKKMNREKEVLWLEFTASDGEYDIVHPVKITVKNVNQAPRIIDFLPSSEYPVRVGQPVIFHIAAKDEDGDALSYKWIFGAGEASVYGADTIERTFTTPGRKKIKVIVDDGRDEVMKVWPILVLEQPYVPPPATPQLPFTVRVHVVEQ